MFAVKLPINSAVFNNGLIALNMFEDVFTFHISHTTWGIMLYVIIDHCWKLQTFSWVILNYVTFMFNSNNPIKVAHPQKIAN